MTALRFYQAEEVRTLLDYEGCIGAVRKAMAALTASASEQPLRTIIPIAPSRLFGVMPGTLPDLHVFGAKLVSAFENPGRPGRTPHRGVITLFDDASGEVVALCDAGAATEIRTAAASAVATDALARGDARRLAIFGCGAQAEAHIAAIATVRRLEDVLVWGRSFDRATAFAERMTARLGLMVRAVADAREAAGQADIICTVTCASEPVLLGDWVRPGTHLNIVGSSYAGPVEIDSALVVKSRYVADSRRSALAAAAEFLVASQAGLVDERHIVAEIGEVLLGTVAGRTSDAQITLYKSLGHVVQDLAALAYLHGRATASGASH